MLSEIPYVNSPNHLSDLEVLIIVQEINEGADINVVIANHPKLLFLCEEFPELPDKLSAITGIPIPTMLRRPVNKTLLNF